VIARVWRGATRADDALEYADYVERTGMQTARALPGSRGTLVLRRTDGDTAEFVTVLLFDSMDGVHDFAGAEPDRAVFFPEDDRYLVERDLVVHHYEVDAQVGRGV
jgi:antibiotic biosynthesis monooxygenase (ABM) superfamily enzyme